MGLDNLKTSLWLATGSGVAFFAGSSFLRWKWPENGLTNHWLVAPFLATTGVVAVSATKKLLECGANSK